MKEATKRKVFSEMTPDELRERYRHFKDELFTLKFQMATGQLEKNHRLEELRRDLARVLTYLKQKLGPAFALVEPRPKRVATPETTGKGKVAKGAKAASKRKGKIAGASK